MVDIPPSDEIQTPELAEYIAGLSDDDFLGIYKLAESGTLFAFAFASALRKERVHSLSAETANAVGAVIVERKQLIEAAREPATQ